MELTDAINHLKESLADPTHKWGCEECKQEHEQLLEWLEDYKQLKADYADLDNRLRTANTEIDRLQSVSNWHSCDEKPSERITYLLTDGYCVYLGYYAVSEKHWTTEEDTDGNSLLYWMSIPKPPRR